MKDVYISPTKQAIEQLIATGHNGPLVMLNMLKFRVQADYAKSPELAPKTIISGEQAYDKYIEAVQSILARFDGELILTGCALPFVIGPPDQQWDRVLLIRQASIDNFMGFIRDPEYLSIVGHRTAALSDSRLLPININLSVNS